MEKFIISGEIVFFLCSAILIIAFLYSSVGHAGASGYIAVMTLFSLSPSTIKPAALVLNILVAAITTWQFWRAGYFSWKLFYPFALASVPCAFIGGYISVPTTIFKLLIGIILLYSAVRFSIQSKYESEPHEPRKAVAIPIGAGLGLLSGITGVGGGIFLTPLLIFMRWSRTKTASAVSACFILVNSISGLMGNVSGTKQLPFFAFPLAMSALVGGTIGSYFGSKRFSPLIIKRLLSIVLFIAGIKMFLR